MSFVLETPFFQRVAAERNFTAYHKMSAHRGLAFVCVVAGGLWSLQNLWF